MNVIQSNINNWLEQAEINWKTSQNLFSTKDYYACLLFCHLTIEKVLKGLVLSKTKAAPPYIHKLTRLAQLAELNLDNDQIANMNKLTDFNILSRYDDYKQQFYKTATKDFTEKYLKITEELLRWIKEQYPKI